jgi:hypothetical protein
MRVVAEEILQSLGMNWTLITVVKHMICYRYMEYLQRTATWSQTVTRDDTVLPLKEYLLPII